jgi:HlyD family secretion protein
MFTKILSTILKHKFIAGFVILGLVIGSYFTFKGGGATQVKYVFAAVERGTIVTSITGSGQVSVSDQVDVKPKVSGDVIYVGVKNGQEVRQGTIIAQIDSKDAQKAVRDAQINLESAKVQLQKMQLNQNNDLPKLQNDIATSETNLTKTYEDAFNTISNAFLELPSIIDGIRAVLYDTTVGSDNQSNDGAYQNLVDTRYATDFIIFINSARNDYTIARDAYAKNFNDFKNISRSSSREEIEKLVDQTLETARLISQAVKSEQNLLDNVVDNVHTYQPKRPIPNAITEYQADIAKYVGQLNGNISSLLNIQNSIRNSQQSLANSKQTLEYNQQFNPLDIIAQENTIKQREAALQDAQDNLANFYIRAPFAGIVAKVNIKRGDSASGGTAVATMITKQRIAEISLNEVDIAQVKVGQKTTLTFDAVDGLTITGEILEVDSLGTVSQGVVTYSVVIGFDTQDERIKPGMSVSAAVITDAKQNVLMIPNSAIKFAGNTNYVEIPGDTSIANQLLTNVANSTGIALDVPPQQKTVQIGVANDSFTEVIGGLQEGDVVITRTVTTTSNTQTTTQGNSLFPIGGGRSTGGFQGR